MSKTYFEKLKDPRWQKKRLEALQKSDFHCEDCGDGESTLHVHHKEYFKGREPWEYEIDQLAVLCEECHAEQHETDDLLKLVCSFLPISGPYSRLDAASLLAGWAGFRRNEKLSNNIFSSIAGEIANLIDGYGTHHPKVDEALTLSWAASVAPRGMVEAMLAFAATLDPALEP